MNRRHFLALSAATCGVAWSGGARASQPMPARRLEMPPLLDTRPSGRLALTATGGQTRFIGGPATPTAGFNQPFLGPTIVMRNGPLAAEVANGWSEEVSVHWHGLIVPGEHDGGPHSAIAPGRVWRPDMQIGQRPAPLWYHSHVHGRTARHVHTGLAGAIHLTDGRDDERGLPSAYGVDDLTLILQDRRIDAAGASPYRPTPTDILNGFHGERMLVNGQSDAVAIIPRGIARLRLVNGSNGRTYSLTFDDGRPMHLVATDGGFLPRPRALKFLRLSPGERAEVLVDFASGSAARMLNARANSATVLDFAVDASVRPRITALPDALDDEPAALPEPAFTRQIALNMGGNSIGETKGHHGAHSAHGQPEGGADDFGINGRPYAMDRIDFEVPLGAVERWVVRGGGGVDHPFHVHGVAFRVLRNGGTAPRDADAGWKDTVLVQGQAELLIHFTQPASAETPFMCHCHILEHEDAGMMAQFVVR